MKKIIGLKFGHLLNVISILTSHNYLLQNDNHININGSRGYIKYTNLQSQNYFIVELYMTRRLLNRLITIYNHGFFINNLENRQIFLQNNFNNFNNNYNFHFHSLIVSGILTQIAQLQMLNSNFHNVIQNGIYLRINYVNNDIYQHNLNAIIQSWNNQFDLILENCYY